MSKKVKQPLSKDIITKCESIKDCLLEKKCSIRQCADAVDIPKSTVHHYIHTYIKQYYHKDYIRIKLILAFNLKHRRKPRRFWKGKYKDGI